MATYYITFEMNPESLPPDPTPAGGNGPGRVYELEKGWSFDGFYIPHHMEMNWYFGDAPMNYHSINKLRIHGLSQGRTNLQVSSAGMQTQYDRDFTEPQVIDLPYNPTKISPELLSTTNYVDLSNRGISIQMKFEGRNTDINMPEPPHVIQVLVVQSSPAGTGFTPY